MANTTIEERRLRLVGKAGRAKERARQCLREADYAERRKDKASASEYRAAARQHEARAHQHTQEAARLSERARAGLYLTALSDKARRARRVASNFQKADSDSLDRAAEIAAEIKAIWAAVDRLQAKQSALPRQGAELRHARLQGKIHGLILAVAEWEREAERFALASPDGADRSSHAGGSSPAP